MKPSRKIKGASVKCLEQPWRHVTRQRKGKILKATTVALMSDGKADLAGFASGSRN